MKDVNEDRQEEKTDSIEKAWQASILGIQPKITRMTLDSK